MRGVNVSSAYFNMPSDLNAGKIRDGSTIWHRMGDVGYLDRDGGLYFCGRKVHVVPFEGDVYYSVPVENIFNRHPKVKRSALVALGKRGEPAIVVEPFSHYWPKDGDEREMFRRELLYLGSQDKISEKIKKVFFHQSFPVDARHNAKIYRDRLSVWATEEENRE